MIRYRRGIALLEEGGRDKILVSISDLRRYLAAWECLVRQKVRVKDKKESA